ncbi:glycerate kinase [Halomonas ramblicola]|uniref:glycerate kinase n=1 Tax=Halomonas ramblicola TaxID=747349 RepID=UPI0025B55088|nr:glycerate kinase [Halomonas ramblicola]MDN3523582.1 glycerate kinase [Halomonas ramblicola]
MRVVLAPDSYKDAVSAEEAVRALRRGVLKACPEAVVDNCPLGDGGEGTLDALLVSMGAEECMSTVTGPMGKSRIARWGWVADQKLAIVELAESSGIQLVPLAHRDAMKASTYGLGEVILDALDHGAERIILTLGGSATNDGGAGMLQALGVRLQDDAGAAIQPGGEGLTFLAELDVVGMDSRLADVQFEVAVDVSNPLCGENGASAIFGPQKGANSDQVAFLDKALYGFAEMVEAALGTNFAGAPGAGAAGGVGFAAMTFLQATPRPGIEIVMELVGFEEKLAGADLVITGEGSVDRQSLSGKTPVGVARAAARTAVPVVLLAGRFGEGWREVHQKGVTAAFPLADQAMGLEEAMARTSELLEDRAEAVIRLYGASRP